MDERRTIERYALDAPATIVIESGKGEKKTLHLHTRDLSSEGAFVVTDEHVREGAAVSLELVLPVEKLLKLIDVKSKVQLKIRGTVVRSNFEGIAINFKKKYKINTLNLDISE